MIYFLKNILGAQTWNEKLAPINFTVAKIHECIKTTTTILLYMPQKRLKSLLLKSLVSTTFGLAIKHAI